MREAPVLGGIGSGLVAFPSDNSNPSLTRTDLFRLGARKNVSQFEHQCGRRFVTLHTNFSAIPVRFTRNTSTLWHSGQFRPLLMRRNNMTPTSRVPHPPHSCVRILIAATNGELPGEDHQLASLDAPGAPARTQFCSNLVSSSTLSTTRTTPHYPPPSALQYQTVPYGNLEICNPPRNSPTLAPTRASQNSSTKPITIRNPALILPRIANSISGSANGVLSLRTASSAPVPVTSKESSTITSSWKTGPQRSRSGQELQHLQHQPETLETILG